MGLMSLSILTFWVVFFALYGDCSLDVPHGTPSLAFVANFHKILTQKAQSVFAVQK